MFNGTVYENVVNGLSGTPMAEFDEAQKRKLVEEACRAAFAHEFVEKMPDVRLPCLERSILSDGYRVMTPRSGSEALCSPVVKNNDLPSPEASSQTPESSSSTKPQALSTPTPKRSSRRLSTMSRSVGPWSLSR